MRATSIDGENYSSSVYRSNVSFETKKNSSDNAFIVIKLITGKVNALADRTSYDTELKMYKRVIPEVQRVLSLAGEYHQVAPKIFYSTTEPFPTLVFEDLQANKFKMIRKRTNLQDTLLVAKRLAQYHAATFYLSRESSLVKQFELGLFTLNENDGVEFIYETFKIFQEVVKGWDGFNLYNSKLQKASEEFLTRARDIYKLKTGGFNVLNHGDFHINNFMVKNEGTNGRIEDLMFVSYVYVFYLIKILRNNFPVILYILSPLI